MINTIIFGIIALLCVLSAVWFAKEAQAKKDWTQYYLVSDQYKNETQIYRTAVEIGFGFGDDLITYQSELSIPASEGNGVKIKKPLSLSLSTTQSQFEKAIGESGLAIVCTSDRLMARA